MRVVRIVITFPILVLLLVAPATAASFKKVSEEVSKSTTPSDTAEQLESCVVTTEAASSNSLDATRAVTETRAFAEAVFTDPNCPDAGMMEEGVGGGAGIPDLPPDTFAVALALAIQTYAIEPGEGESEGDPVSLCYRASRNQSANATGLGVHSEIGFFDPNDIFETLTTSVFTDPIQIIVLPAMGGLTTIFEFGPQIIASGSSSDVSQGSFVARIGDTIRLLSGSAVFIHGSGIGNARVEAANRLSVEFGVCDVGVPAMSTGPMVALIALLLGAGTLLLSRAASFSSRSSTPRS